MKWPLSRGGLVGGFHLYNNVCTLHNHYYYELEKILKGIGNRYVANSATIIMCMLSVAIIVFPTYTYIRTNIDVTNFTVHIYPSKNTTTLVVGANIVYLCPLKSHQTSNII